MQDDNFVAAPAVPARQYGARRHTPARAEEHDSPSVASQLDADLAIDMDTDVTKYRGKHVRPGSEPDRVLDFQPHEIRSDNSDREDRGELSSEDGSFAARDGVRRGSTQSLNTMAEDVPVLYPEAEHPASTGLTTVLERSSSRAGGGEGSAVRDGVGRTEPGRASRSVPRVFTV